MKTILRLAWNNVLQYPTIYEMFAVRKMNMYFYLKYSSTLKWQWLLKPFLNDGKDGRTIVPDQHDCWCSGEARNQGIYFFDITNKTWTAFINK